MSKNGVDLFRGSLTKAGPDPLRRGVTSVTVTQRNRLGSAASDGWSAAAGWR